MINVNAFPIGRLGNQMFQVAAALGYAKKHRCAWGFPSDTRETPRLREFFPGIPVLNGHFKRYVKTDPKDFNYEELPQFNQDTTLVGFFQSIKYFEHCQDEVKRVFKLDIKPVDAVSIHVRRTDYVQYANSFPPVTIEYITQAMQYFLDNINPYQKFVVFSDDIQWCKENIKLWTTLAGTSDAKTLIHAMDRMIEFSEGRNEFEDLSLMASCSHHIIANSTFSWWGAYLGHNPDRIIVSPHHENWFGPGFSGQPPKDIIPEGWHQIKFR